MLSNWQNAAEELRELRDKLDALENALPREENETAVRNRIRQRLSKAFLEVDRAIEEAAWLHGVNS